MLTTDDQRARIALIKACDVLQDPDNYCAGEYQIRRGFFSHRYQRCMMGEIAYQLGLLSNGGHPEKGDPLLNSIYQWFLAALGIGPGAINPDVERFNDSAGHGPVAAFLRERVAEIDRAVMGDPRVVRWDFPHEKQPQAL